MAGARAGPHLLISRHARARRHELAPSLAESLRSLGHDAVHARDLGFERATDEDVFARAAHESRAAVTFDLDFGNIVRVAAKVGPGIVLLRLRSVPASKVGERLRVALANTEAALQAGAIVLVEEFRIRIRAKPPRQ